MAEHAIVKKFDVCLYSRCKLGVQLFRGQLRSMTVEFSWRTSALFMGPLIPLLQTSGDVCPVFQRHDTILCFGRGSCMHGRGMCPWQGDMHVWQGTCVHGSRGGGCVRVHGREHTCMAGSMHVWQGACICCRGGCVQGGVGVGEECKWAVRILLECFLVIGSGWY